MLNLKTIEDAYQSSLRVEENILRRKNQKNRGRGSVEEVSFMPLRMRHKVLVSTHPKKEGFRELEEEEEIEK